MSSMVAAVQMSVQGSTEGQAPRSSYPDRQKLLPSRTTQDPLYLVICGDHAMVSSLHVFLLPVGLWCPQNTGIPTRCWS